MFVCDHFSVNVDSKVKWPLHLDQDSTMVGNTQNMHMLLTLAKFKTTCILFQAWLDNAIW